MRNTLLPIAKSGFIVGTLDILAAFLYYFIKTGKNPLSVLKFVAGGFFGEKAFRGGNSMYFFGLFLHYLIAFCFTVFFYLVISKLNSLKNLLVLRGLLYGLFVWAIMNVLVVPLSKLPGRPIDPVNALINILILMVCVGIPLSFLENNYKKINAVNV
jgi:hypothetical protein